jgi:hypothetical protein
MIQVSRSTFAKPIPLSIPVILELLQVIHVSMHDDAVLGRPARTVERAIDELSALRQTAMDVMVETEPALPPSHILPKHMTRRRLC